MTARTAPIAVAIPDRARALSGIQAAALLSATVAGLVYLRTMLPGVSVGDWGEMQFVPARLDVPHPTGYPLYALLGKLFSLIPVGSFAWRAGLLSVVAASAAVGVAVLIAGRLGVRPLIAGAAGVTLAATGTLWQEATFPEMNGLHLLLVGLVVHRALVWRAERRDRDLLLGALLAGLALSNHLLAITAVPIVILFVLVDARERLFRRPPLIVQAALLFAAGLLPYLFIPLRALAGPPEIYASLATWQGFASLVSGETFRGQMHFLSGESMATAWRAVPDVVAHLQARSHGLFLVAGAIGVVFTLRRDRWLGLLLLALAALNIYFYVNYIGDLHHYLLLTWLILALGLALLVELLARWLETRTSGRSRGAEILLVLLPLAIVGQQWSIQDQSQNQTGEQLAAQIFAALPPNAVVLTYWDTLTTLSYKHCMEGVRPDVSLRAYDTAARVTCDPPPGPLEDEVRRGRPAFALFAVASQLEPLLKTFILVPGPMFDLPYGQRYLDYQGMLYRLELKTEPDTAGPADTAGSVP